MSINQIELITAITKEIERQGVSNVHVSQLNVIIEAANSIIEEFAREQIPATKDMGLQAWLMSDDTGLSSRYMASVLSGKFEGMHAIPHDVDDFGRCIRLLKAVPELASKIGMMRAASPQWSALIDNWDGICAQIVAGDTVAADLLIRNCGRRDT